MECLLGIACKDFVILAADRTNAMSILVMKENEDKIFKLSDSMAMAVVGEAGDTVQFAEYIAKNIQLYKMKNGYALSPKAAANYTAKNLADYLRSRTPYHVNMLLGGFDKHDGAQLYFIDYLASIVKLPFAAHGYGGLLSLSIMDRYYKEDLTPEQTYEILKLCVKEVHRRLIINLPNFKVQIIDKDGIRELDPIVSKDLV
ncbi:proteasome subunit beta type-2-like [Lycorma delicatula]|uniref:proteasome subunit beta type-2-like n=1 Tax=Lycorma delicatula TaxID=130591 RepID=UPI003F5151DB